MVGMLEAKREHLMINSMPHGSKATWGRCFVSFSDWCLLPVGPGTWRRELLADGTDKGSWSTTYCQPASYEHQYLTGILSSNVDWEATDSQCGAVITLIFHLRMCTPTPVMWALKGTQLAGKRACTWIWAAWPITGLFPNDQPLPPASCLLGPRLSIWACPLPHLLFPS